MSALPQYEIFAIKYAHREAKRHQHFVGGDPHDGPMNMDYFTWVIRGDKASFVFDAGFTAEVAKQRGRQHLRCPVEAMAPLGIKPADVKDVIISHLHYDHVGNYHKYPNARFHLQEKEMHFATGRYMRYPAINRSFEPDDVCGIIRLNFQDRVALLDGAVEFAPGISLHPTPGHTPGLQSMRVHTRRGWVVLAADAAHYYENLRKNRPYTTVLSIGDMVDSWRTLERLADSPRHIIPGHDPIVMQEYPALDAANEGIIIRLDVPPKDV